jgi:cation diffusion facilitator CzcD-associated flavoprotein CzcO
MQRARKPIVGEKSTAASPTAKKETVDLTNSPVIRRMNELQAQRAVELEATKAGAFSPRQGRAIRKLHRTEDREIGLAIWESRRREQPLEPWHADQYRADLREYARALGKPRRFRGNLGPQFDEACQRAGESLVIFKRIYAQNSITRHTIQASCCSTATRRSERAGDRCSAAS